MKSNKPQTRKGHCENFVNCELADKGVIQEIPVGDDFVCLNSNCKKDLVEEPDKPKKKWIWFLLGAVVIVVLIVIFARGCGNTPPPSPQETIDTTFNECGDTIIINGTDTNIIRNTQIDTTYNENGDTIIKRGCEELETRIYKKPEPRKRDKEIVPRDNDDDPIPNVLPVYGRYSGPRNSAGEPDGKGGQVTVTTEYHWNMRVFSPGDVIKNTTYENGQLKHGRVIKKNGDSFDI